MLALILVMPIVLAFALGYAAGGDGRSWSLEHFTSYLAAVTRRNLPLGSSLGAYAQDLPGWRFGKRKVLLRIADEVDSGGALADAMDRYVRVFPGPYHALIRAAERGGNLSRVLDSLADTVDFRNRSARNALGLAAYPAAIFVAVALVAALIGTVVMPHFDQMLQEFTGEEAPDVFGLHVMSASSPWIVGLIWAAGAAVAILVIAAVLLFARGEGAVIERAWSWLLWHLPVIRRYERRRAISQYALAAARLMEAGLPTHEALKLAADASGNTHFDGIACEAASGVAEGGKLSIAFATADRRRELPPELLWYIEVGEAAGRLPRALEQAAEGATERSRRALRRVSSLVFPLGILAAAAFVAAIAFSVFGAMLALMEQAL